TLKWQFASLEPDDRGIHETRGYACEIVAWRLLTHLSEREVIDYLLYELPPLKPNGNESSDTEAGPIEGPINNDGLQREPLEEHTWLLSGHAPPDSQHPRLARNGAGFGTYRTDGTTADISDEEDPTSIFTGLNALEIAAVAEAKKFLSQRVVQKIVNGIWCGEIVFWESLSVHTKKRGQLYNERRADPYCRLRVPKYQKFFEALFFASFLALYYAVLLERNPRHITPIEVLLYVWLAAFAYEEFGELRDAGMLFYAIDFWSLWDLGIIGYHRRRRTFPTRSGPSANTQLIGVIGLVKDSDQIIDTSFDILSLEALFLVPRYIDGSAPSMAERGTEPH
ncbi:MAG: hypothetical protein M1830_001361, partial [Pleopsidium flavum]